MTLVCKTDLLNYLSLKYKYMIRVELSRMKYFFLHILLIAFLITVGSCARRATFQQSSVVPAAHGSVKVKKDDNRNYRIDVEISDLAEVEKVYSRNYSYFVWMETEEGEVENLGNLVSSKGFFSNQRKAELETVSRLKPSRIFITAEREERPRQPGNRVILRTRNF